MEGLIPLMSPKVHPTASLFSLSTFSNSSSWLSVRSDAIITGKVSLEPKNTYLRESSKGFDSNVGSEVWVTEEGGQAKKAEGINLITISSSIRQPTPESFQAYTSS